MKIRETKPSDLTEWATLRSKLWPNSVDNHISEIEEYFRGGSIDIAQAYVLGNDSGSLSGFIELNIRNFAEGSRSPRIPYVEAWYVEENFRGMGWGKKFMQIAENWALEQNFTELASDTEIDNLKSISIHKKLGFKETERIVCFLKSLK